MLPVSSNHPIPNLIVNKKPKSSNVQFIGTYHPGNIQNTDGDKTEEKNNIFNPDGDMESEYSDDMKSQEEIKVNKPSVAQKKKDQITRSNFQLATFTLFMREFSIFSHGICKN